MNEDAVTRLLINDVSAVICRNIQESRQLATSIRSTEIDYEKLYQIIRRHLVEFKKDQASGTGLTEGEQRVSDHLAEAFNEFCKLDRTHPNEMEEFVSAIHRLQDLLAVRIVRRQFPEGWPTYRREGKSK